MNVKNNHFRFFFIYLNISDPFHNAVELRLHSIEKTALYNIQRSLFF